MKYSKNQIRNWLLNTEYPEGATDESLAKATYNYIRGLEDGVKHTNDFCLCERNDYGFDYHEKHLHMGEPKSGKRWKTPRDYIKDNQIGL